MAKCKRCGSIEVIKNGIVRGHQRYRCRQCRCNFIEGDRRVDADPVAKGALAVILYALGKASFNMLGRIVGVSRSPTFRRIKQEAAALPEPTAPGDVREMEFDEMWHVVGSKKTNSGPSRRWIVARGEPWPGCSAIAMLQRSKSSIAKSST